VSELAEWMSKDGSWGGTKRKQKNRKLKYGCNYSVMKAVFTDFTWDDMTNL
jgi:hypothetical protein